MIWTLSVLNKKKSPFCGAKTKAEFGPLSVLDKKEIQKTLPVSEKSRKKTVLYKKRFVKEKALKIIFCEHY